MKGLALRLVTGLAGAIGFFPAPPDCVLKLQALRGEFRRSRAEVFFRLVFAATTVAGGSLFAGMAYREYFIASSGRGGVVPSVLALLLFGLAFVPLSSLPRRYVFDSGEFSAYGWRDRLLWQEDLHGLETVSCTNARGVIWMTLKWRHRKRRIELLDTLANALSGAQPAQCGR